MTHEFATGAIPAAVLPQLALIEIVLVQPQGALNLGSIARVMKNMGLAQLVLVDPQCDHLGEEARRMAVHAGDILAAARVVPTLPAAIAQAQRTIATTARSRSVDTPLLLPEQGLPWLLNQPSALIFGPEDRGLSNGELSYAQRFVKIPSTEAYPSLNLAQSVAVCARELVRTAMASQITAGQLPGRVLGDGLDRPTPDSNHAPDRIIYDTLNPDLAPLGLVEGYYEHLEAVLLEIGYLQPHTAGARMEKFRRLFNRSQLSSHEVAMLRGILRQVQWAIGQAAISKIAGQPDPPIDPQDFSD